MRCGIDEAGLGPLVGSLFVVGVAVEGQLDDIRESKEVFRRSLRTYAKAEGVVLTVLKRLGIYTEDLPTLWDRVFGSGGELYTGLRLPMFGGREVDLTFEVRKLVALEIPAHRLRKHRFLTDAWALTEIALQLPCTRVISGLAGGVKHYERFLTGWEREVLNDGILYRKGGREVRFVKGADRKFKEVALASLFAKYFRELHMMAVNRLVGYHAPIPMASGYPVDPKTPSLIRALLSKRLEHLLR